MGKQKNYGKIFEVQVLSSVPAYMYKLRIKDTVMRLKGDTNPCDMIIFYNGKLFMLELKSTQNTSLPFSNIHFHQFQDLEIASKVEGINAGFLIEMRNYGETYYLDINKALEYVNTSGRKSFSITYLRQNAIKVEQTLKRTRYGYNIEKLITQDLK